MLKKLGLAVAAAIGLSMIATPAMAAPPLDAPAPGMTSCEAVQEATEATESEASESEAIESEAIESEGMEAEAAQTGIPQLTCVPRPQVSQQCVFQQSIPRPIRLPCLFGFQRPHFLGSGGLSALLNAWLNLNLNLRPHVLLGSGSSCHSFSFC